jgi:hypothetical protein
MAWRTALSRRWRVLLLGSVFLRSLQNGVFIAIK